MRFSILAALCATVSAAPFVVRQEAIPTPDQIAALAPDLGALPNTNPNQFGDCDGPRQADGTIPRVPCQCPPLHDAYIQAMTTNVLAGHAVNNTVVKISFPTGDSLNDKHGRITAAIITLQNLNGPGKGCPGVSTTLGIQAKNLDTCGDFFCNGSSSAAVAATSSTPANVAAAASTTTAVAAATTSSAPAATGTALTRELVDQLAPDLGGQPNTNPNASGDCDGPRQPNGQIPKVPCACPPLRDDYITQLLANAQAGHALNNPTVKVNFPLGDSVQDKHGRITAAVITLQNLNGPGKGCPTVSTTLPEQSNNLDTCGDFFCNGNNTTSTDAASAATTAAPAQQTAPAQIAAVAQDGASTVTVTIHTVVTSIVTVTAGEGAATSTAAAVAATTSAAAVADVTEAASTTTAAAAASSSGAVISRDLVDQLAPDLGSHPNNNPNQFGDCDGPVQPNGQIQHVPCACPPNRDDFITALLANIEAGHAVNNPTVKVDFPTGNSKADQHARITASTITLQNLNGPGKGCPNTSTTFAAQSNAIGN